MKINYNATKTNLVTPLVFINNQFIPDEQACISHRDLSIQRGYGVFDFFRLIQNTPLYLEEHLDRFYFSAAQMRLDAGKTRDELKLIIHELIQKNNLPNSGIRLTLTGGNSPDGYQLVEPNLIISQHLFNPPTENQINNGIKLVTYNHQRQLPHVKTIDYLMAIWLQPYVKEKQADDILYYKDGLVSECPRSNFFLVLKDVTIITPANNILKGITRMKVLKSASQFLNVEERDIIVDEIRLAGEAFITSTTKQILPAVQIDGDVIGNGTPGKITKKLLDEYKGNNRTRS